MLITCVMRGEESWRRSENGHKLWFITSRNLIIWQDGNIDFQFKFDLESDQILILTPQDNALIRCQKTLNPLTSCQVFSPLMSRVLNWELLKRKQHSTNLFLSATEHSENVGEITREFVFIFDRIRGEVLCQCGRRKED